jgi:hypothetical protein
MKSVDFHGYTIYENGKIIGLYGKEVKKRINNGRYEIRLNIEGKRKNYMVSRLVYYVFNPFDIEDKNICVSYKDNDKLNIDLSNLYLTHRKELIQGDKHQQRAKLTNEQAEEIRQLYKGKTGSNQHDKEGYSLSDLAAAYGVSKANIKMIIKGGSRNEKEYKLK